jgi:hypothetical protein
MGNKNDLSSGFIKNWSIFWTSHSVLLETDLDKSLIPKSKLIHCAAPIESPKSKPIPLDNEATMKASSGTVNSIGRQGREYLPTSL